MVFMRVTVAKELIFPSTDVKLYRFFLRYKRYNIKKLLKKMWDLQVIDCSSTIIEDQTHQRMDQNIQIIS